MRNQRTKSVETSQQKILKAALKIFVDKGFAGTSMSTIAQKAGVPQSLIYHYFKNKEELWRQSKEAFVSGYGENNGVAQGWDNLPLPVFMERFVRQRFNFYMANPMVIRMMNWQRLEADKTLSGQSPITPTWLTHFLEDYKKSGQIRKDIQTDMMAAWITASITAPLFDHYQQYRGDLKLQEDYIKMVTANFLCALQVLEKNS